MASRKMLFNRPSSLIPRPRCAFFHYLFTFAKLEFLDEEVFPSRRGKIDLIKENFFPLVVISKLSCMKFIEAEKRNLMMRVLRRLSQNVVGGASS
jgi:hypothetical protein